MAATQHMRQLTGNWSLAVRIVAVAFSLFVIGAAIAKSVPFLPHRSLFVLFGLALAFAVNPTRKSSKSTGGIPWWDLLFIFLVAVACLNIFFRWEHYVLSYFTIDEPFEHVMGAILVVLVLEGGRRTIGWTFPILTTTIIIYAFVGPLIPGRFGHPGIPVDLLMQQLYQSDVGMWGAITGIAAKTVAMFIIFGAVLQYTGGGQTFIDLATIIAGKFRGGPALVAVISSAMFGTMSGSTVANVATTGCFTIPLMKRLGYRPEFAGAVEASASTVGQLMPPIMGAAAFIMAELLGVSYLAICAAAIVPALLYFLSIFSMVRMEALRHDLPAMPRDLIPSFRGTFTWGKLAPLFLPLGVLVLLIGMGFTAHRSAFYATVAALALFLFKDFSSTGLKERFFQIVGALEKGGRTLVDLVPLIVCAQIVVTLIMLTGISPKFTTTIMSLAGGTPFLALLVTAVVCLILGAGIPTTAAYLLVVGTIGSTLIQLGVPSLNTHMFVFYFAIISSITPPVCVAAFTAATIAVTSWWKVGWIAMRLAAVSYVMPFLFVYQPVFLLQGETGEILVAIATAVAGIVLLAAGFVGYLHRKLSLVARCLLGTAGVMLFLPGTQTDGIAVVLAAVGLLGEHIVARFSHRERSTAQ